MRPWKAYLRWLRRKPLVRPWALSAPILVLLICLPLLRPLRHPDPRTVSDDEQARLATIEALVEHHTLAIEGTGFRATRSLIVRRDGHWFSDQSPVMSVILSGPYWVMHRFGLTLDHNPILAEYLLTLLGVTLPVAFATGLLYRMGRLFELRRPYRAGLAAAVVIGSGWISYATVLCGGAAAAALLVTSAACLLQTTLTRRRVAAYVWIWVAGIFAALATTYELPALIFLVLLLGVVCVLKWGPGSRAVGVVLYIAGAAIPLSLYVGLNRPITGDLKPGFLHPELRAEIVERPRISPPGVTVARWAEDDVEEPTVWQSFWAKFEHFTSSFLGDHGLLTHFPVLIFGLIGVSMVMHRHWPMTTKVLAIVTLVGSLTIIVGYVAVHSEPKNAMFANRWFVVFLPLTLFWAGAWLRRSHPPIVWATAAVLWSISAAIALLGATDPQPRKGYDRYTAAGALMNLVESAPTPGEPKMIADR